MAKASANERPDLQGEPFDNNNNEEVSLDEHWTAYMRMIELYQWSRKPLYLDCANQILELTREKEYHEQVPLPANAPCAGKRQRQFQLAKAEATSTEDGEGHRHKTQSGT